MDEASTRSPVTDLVSCGSAITTAIPATDGKNGWLAANMLTS